jgi:hypothetical protein
MEEAIKDIGKMVNKMVMVLTKIKKEWKRRVHG